ncbi:MAG: TRAP transporter permease [Geminicoccaceae bacterium]|nr:MAG: TRAP transporter permease [Geminicoccaceae bacterium]
MLARGLEDEPAASNQRNLKGALGMLLIILCVTYTAFHLMVLNVTPLETWTFRIVHIAGGLVIGFTLIATGTFSPSPGRGGLWPNLVLKPFAFAALGLVLYALGSFAYAWWLREQTGLINPPPWVWQWGAWSLVGGSGLAMLVAWLEEPEADRVGIADWALAGAGVAVALYLVFNLGALQFRAGVMPTRPDFWVSLVGCALILELTRRVAGMPLVIIAAVFILYGFVGPHLPGFLAHRGYSFERLFTYIYTDNGILGPTTAVSSTYIILFITFGAFLQASKVGDYFVSVAFAAAGRARGGPAKVAIFGSGLMGMINGTSAGNVVATGSLTIPLMKKVGYQGKSAGAIEAAASSGGQIMPPVMGAGAFIMAEVTGIPYQEIAFAALIPAFLYFVSVYFMVDFEAAKTGMRGLREDELPVLRELAKQVYLFAPILMLIVALFLGYSVIRAGTYALIAAAVVSWLTPHALGPRGIVRALELSAHMVIPLVAVCACAGIIVGVIGLTGVGLRFSSLLLALAEQSQLLAMIFAMGISILLGMGMPTTAAYAVAASVVAPGLIQLGVPVLTAHFFVFYFAVMSAITPPVALAAYAAAGISGSKPMATSVAAFKVGLAAFIVPFMFFYSPALLMQGSALQVLQVLLTAGLGVYFLAAAVQGWLLARLNLVERPLVLVAALSMIAGGWMTDLVGLGLGALVVLNQRRLRAQVTTA